ncbi:exosortase system-associated protein, TIGR04073 family [Methylococcus sp. EFPC2]|uniref:exosortase system-associated protein, TIGR04073 family n=1 Tax=Methylococcus sp. EFPC2 TaxID=2812648 RepID=UPI0019689AD1|nr:exosortase system-associated protein, TIGR04073 family [Methylococcus sp. EFPC2]QSA95584.1 exosortase system-associated protein, TIGR04073 family [Methylococcus sp. EFPC2]
MNHFRTLLTAGSLALLTAFSAPSYARHDQQDQSWGSRFVSKASHGLANVATGVVELPKNIGNITSDSNIFAGLTVGVVRGVFHTVSRTLVGAAEFITAPIPTDDFVTPGYVWERYSEDTRYFGLHYPLYWTSFGSLDEGEDLRAK